ncbi:hypothetical protein GW17_00007552 [Ensete ventricosum]|nr:hypothetical protein GW17_00007552 [Ensete ventricosum]
MKLKKKNLDPLGCSRWSPSPGPLRPSHGHPRSPTPWAKEKERFQSLTSLPSSLRCLRLETLLLSHQEKRRRRPIADPTYYFSYGHDGTSCNKLDSARLHIREDAAVRQPHKTIDVAEVSGSKPEVPQDPSILQCEEPHEKIAIVVLKHYKTCSRKICWFDEL